MRIMILAICALFSGCSSLHGAFENRITTTLSGDRAFVASLYGPFGITAELSAEDAQELRRMHEAAKQAETLMIILRLQQTKGL